MRPERGRAHRLAAYPWCSTDVVEGEVRARLGCVAGVGLALLATTTSGAEVTRLVKVRVVIGSGFTSFRHEVTVSSKDSSRRVISVLLWQNPSLLEQPISMTAPAGWLGRAIPRERGSGKTWAIQFECQSERAPDPEHDEPAAQPAAQCGIQAGQELKFYVVLPFQSEEVERQPILVGFSDGRIGIAS